jgi:hypothetical protein
MAGMKQAFAAGGAKTAESLRDVNGEKAIARQLTTATRDADCRRG